MKRKIRILYLEPVTCCRLIKEAIALKKIDNGNKYEMWLATLEGPFERYRGWGLEPFEFMIRLGDFNQNIANKQTSWFTVLGSLIRESRHFDLVASSNAPDLFTAFAALNGKAPVIHNCHDVTTLFPELGERPDIRQDEQISLSMTQGQMFVSEEQRDYCKHAYSLELPNSIVYPCYSSQDYIPRDPLPRLSDIDGERHLGYEGGISIDRHNESHRYYWPLFKKLCEQGVHVHVHTAVSYPNHVLPSERWAPDVKKYLHWHPTMSPPLFIRAMSAYDANLVGFHGSTPFTDMAFPNKLAESMSAGLPQVCTNHKTIREVVEKNRIGHVIDYKDPKINWEYLDKCRTRVEKLRWEFTHEYHIHEVEALYERAMEIGKP